MTQPADIDAAMRPEINPVFLFRWEDTQDSYVLLYPEGVVKLNPTAGEILKHCTGEATLGEMLPRPAGRARSLRWCRSTCSASTRLPIMSRPATGRPSASQRRGAIAA
jgi:hypothetical protein